MSSKCFKKVSDPKQRHAYFNPRHNFPFLIEYTKLKGELSILKETLYTDHYSWLFLSHDYLYLPFEQEIVKLIESGFIQHWIKKHSNSALRAMEVENSGPKVFSLDELAIGFHVWLVFLGTSFIVFVSELIWRCKSPI